VATMASPRRLARALPRKRSLSVPPYMSAVSKKLIPASSAAWTTSADCFSSIVMPKLLQPRPTTETVRDPMRRVCINVVQAFRPALTNEVGDVTADRLRAIVFDRCPRQCRGNRVLQVVTRGGGSLDADP